MRRQDTRRQVPRRFSRLDVALLPIGRYKPAWFMDVHEMSYIIWGLLEDHRLFGDPQSLAAARKGADYLVQNWSILPPDWVIRIQCVYRLGGVANRHQHLADLLRPFRRLGLHAGSHQTHSGWPSIQRKRGSSEDRETLTCWMTSATRIGRGG